MKRTVIAALALAAAAIHAVALTPDQIIKRFRSAENADYVHVPKFLVKMGLATAGNDVPLAGNLSGVTVLDLSGTSAAIRSKFVSEVDKISGYETLVSTTEGNEKVLILTKTKGDKFEDFVIVSVDSADCTMVKLAGKFSQKEINDMINKKSK